MNLQRNRIFGLSTIIVMMASFIPVSLVSKSAECAMADSQMIVPAGKVSLRKVNAKKIRQMLENKIVSQRLRDYGLSEKEVLSKMDKMSDEQIHQLAALSDRISSGAYYRGGYVPTETLILIIFLTAAFAVLLVAVAASG
ncbi:MAG: hypothetical protein C4291_07710 [Candidatus Dadabacteria bacterium]